MVSSFGVGQRKWEERSTRAGLREVTFSSGKGAKEKRICKELVVIHGDDHGDDHNDNDITW